GHPDCGTGTGHRRRSVYSGGHGRAAVAGVLADRAVLGGMGIRRLERHEGRLAGYSGDRRVFRDPAIRDLELHQSLDRRYRRLADLDGLPHPVPESLAAEAALAVAGAARQGRIGSDDGLAEADGQDGAEPDAAMDRLAAIDHRLRGHAV